MVLFGASCAISAVGLELAIRASGSASHLYTEPAFQWSRDRTFWRYRPGFDGVLLGPTRVRIGPNGERQANPVPSTSSSDYDVAVFGDSVVFGQGVDERDTFSARLERKLRTSGIAARVLNFGVQGHSLEMVVAHAADRIPVTRPSVVILGFIADDLNPSRAQNRVDKYGYLTKAQFGSSPAHDWLRAALRRSHLALLLKAEILRFQNRPGETRERAYGSGIDTEPDRPLARLRTSLRRFDELARGVPRIVLCADLVQTNLTHAIHAVMKSDFPHLLYLHGPPAFQGFSSTTLRVPRDGHPNALAHQIYANLLLSPVRDAFDRTSAPGRLASGMPAGME